MCSEQNSDQVTELETTQHLLAPIQLRQQCLGFYLGKKKPQRSSSGGRDDSPDSIIFTNESNFSLFSSAYSGSIDRCSFASDQVYDHDTLVSELSKHLEGSDPDLAPNISTVHEIDFPLYNEENAKALEEQEGEGEGEDYVTLDPGKCSFSQALRDCQHGRLKLEALPGQKKPERQRHVSLDLNNLGSNATGSPPGIGGMRKSSVSSRKLDTFPSPGTPNYWRGSVGSQKGWSSERVPLPANGGRRYVTAGVLPFNPGRTLPSKWEDAEKWIFSPFAGDGVNRSSKPPPHRRPKSKSGPIGQPEIAYTSAYSPSAPKFEGRSVENYVARSPFSAGVLAIDALPNQRSRSDGGSSSGDGSIGGGIPYAVNGDSCIVRSASIHGWSSSLLSQSSLSGSRDGSKDAVTMSSQTISRRDMATQMSPEGSTPSSPKRTSFSSSPPSLLPIMELQSHHSKLEVRDVEVDDRVTVTRWSRKHGPRVPRKGFADVKDRKKRASETRASAWEIAETGLSKSKREEAKITAWENLQKAKAETAIRKLEMKLEKKRSSSMDKIMHKLRSAQRKAQDMRNSVSSKQTRQVARTTGKALSFRKPGQIGALGGCFTCHAC
ncbi:Remorin [Macleaya cordata]|uniref:Remorin n=1 Tax=Macleaya cordata TaxID=56857 RepID=A0A200QZ01_MACCD|nr:Remorin [Macleaya cordata]